MTRQTRRAYICQRAQASPEVTVQGLTRELGVSAMTVRRDLRALAHSGMLMRTHGGAVATERVGFEFAFRRDSEHMLDAKRAIAAVAAGLVQDGQRVLLDTGTTTLEVARALALRRRLTVVTTSLAIVSALQFASGIDTILLGGFLRSGSPDLWGPITERNLAELHVEWAFVGADAVDGVGQFYCNDLNVARLAGRMMQAADSVYVVADSSKFGRKGLMRFGGPPDVDGVIVDGALDEATVAGLARAGLNVLAAEIGEGRGEGVRQ